ncbi:glycosyltransferase [Pseudomonas brassicacearum]|uniref:glycosyltransferase family 2 protein n=1 Tax=Pseudomonas brassicacearum TaxID=930166 RepID=UPI000F47D4C6|nr:glycosyltransferase family 2 protein [Pseudomonas brassicacearum]ROM78186.1 glycosyltransferase [Pseudomonas brassicacearum]
MHPMSSLEISVVIPVYQAESLVDELLNQLTVTLNGITTQYEIILVEDRSPDNSWLAIQKARKSYPNVKAVRLSRNFGQHHAISAGLSLAQGRWVVVMDCDLQDQPSEIPKLYEEAQKGFDIVLARRAVRQDNWLKRLSSRIFYGTLGYLTGVEQDATVANFGIYNKKVIAAINQMSESIRYFPTMVRWVGFKSTKLDVVHAARPEGKTSYNFKRLLNLSLDICLANSEKPIRLTIKLGLLVAFTGFIYAAYTAIRAIMGEIPILGYASILVSVWVLSGLMICIMGVIGLYVGKSFEGIKNRPLYLIDEVEEP